MCKFCKLRHPTLLIPRLEYRTAKMYRFPKSQICLFYKISRHIHLWFRRLRVPRRQNCILQEVPGDRRIHSSTRSLLPAPKVYPDYNLLSAVLSQAFYLQSYLSIPRHILNYRIPFYMYLQLFFLQALQTMEQVHKLLPQSAPLIL